MPCIAGFLWWLQGIRRYFAISSPEASGLVRWFTVHMVTFIVWFIPHCASCPSPIFYLSWPFPRTFIQTEIFVYFWHFHLVLRGWEAGLCHWHFPTIRKTYNIPQIWGFICLPTSNALSSISATRSCASPGKYSLAKASLLLQRPLLLSQITYIHCHNSQVLQTQECYKRKIKLG